MPPKGKKGKSSKGKGKSKKNNDVERPTVKETLLQSELDKRIQELADLKLRAHAAQAENDLLNNEAKKVRTATSEYMSFMSKKTQYRQTQVVTLSDYYQKQIQDIGRDKENMHKEYKEKKEDVHKQLIEKEKLLFDLNEELKSLNDYEVIHDKNNEEIKRLQNEISRMRSEHVHKIDEMKMKYEKEVQTQRTEENAKVEQIRRQANREAEQYLYDQTLGIQDENVELRKKLKSMLKKVTALNDLKQRLEEEQLELINRMKLIADLRKIRLDRVSSNIPADSSAVVPYEE